MSDKVKVEITGSVDFGKGPVELGVHLLSPAEADDVIKAGAGCLVKNVETKDVETEEVETEDVKAETGKNKKKK
jgi:hypothetical protein